MKCVNQELSTPARTLLLAFHDSRVFHLSCSVCITTWNTSFARWLVHSLSRNSTLSRERDPFFRERRVARQRKGQNGTIIRLDMCNWRWTKEDFSSYSVIVFSELPSPRQLTLYQLVTPGFKPFAIKRFCRTKMIQDYVTSVNSISSIPSPVYQCKKALRLNMAVNCSPIRLNSSWIAVLLPMNVEDILSPRGGISQTAVLTLLGIHSTK